MKVANLDAEGVYWGYREADQAFGGNVVLEAEQIPVDQRLPGVTYLAGIPDNAPGRYRWNAELGRFDPMGPLKIRTSPSAPSPERALYEMVRQDGDAAPAYAKNWADWFERSLDT